MTNRDLVLAITDKNRRYGDVVTASRAHERARKAGRDTAALAKRLRRAQEAYERAKARLREVRGMEGDQDYNCNVETGSQIKTLETAPENPLHAARCFSPAKNPLDDQRYFRATTTIPVTGRHDAAGVVDACQRCGCCYYRRNGKGWECMDCGAVPCS